MVLALVTPLAAAAARSRVPALAPAALELASTAAPGPTAEVRVGAAGLVARLEAAGFAASGRRASVSLRGSLEEKGALERSTRPEEVGADGRAHIALCRARGRPDLWSVAAAQLVAMGAPSRSAWLEPAGVWLAGRRDGEPLAAAVARLTKGGVLPSPTECVRPPVRWRSPLIQTPARAVMIGAVCRVAGPHARRALLAWLAAPDSSGLATRCARAGVARQLVERRYAACADSLARLGAGQLRRPARWRPADGFQCGVCLAHATNVNHGYLSRRCEDEIDRLRAMGANAISLTPFGFMRGGRPEIDASAQAGARGESDEAVCEAAAMAHARGIRVWLKPHLWSHGWTGALDFDAEGWRRFEDEYREFIVHYALLAERERFEGLAIGHELPTATARDPGYWRELIGRVRRIYSGTLTYDAHWDEEVRRIPFWDALDAIGVSQYAPLAARPTRSDGVLHAGAARALEPLRALSARWKRPVLLLELGYPATSHAATTPWRQDGGSPDRAAQRACYAAAVSAVSSARWLGGVFWWKWYTTDVVAGLETPSFSPQGEPAEWVLASALRQWRGRPVTRP